MAAALALVAGLGTAASALSHGSAHAHEAAAAADDHDHGRHFEHSNEYGLTAHNDVEHSHARIGTAPASRSFPSAFVVAAEVEFSAALLQSTFVVFPKYVVTLADPPPHPQTSSRPPPQA